MAKKSLIVKAARPQKFKTRNYTRCNKCGRPRAVFKKFGLCRICLRELAHEGVIPGMEGYSFFARVDEETLQAVAKATGGEFFRAQNAQDLHSIYAKLSSRMALETRDTEISVLAGLAALLLIVSSLGLSLYWLRRS